MYLYMTRIRLCKMADAFEIKLNSKEVCFVDCHAHISAKEFSEVM